MATPRLVSSPGTQPLGGDERDIPLHVGTEGMKGYVQGVVETLLVTLATVTFSDTSTVLWWSWAVDWGVQHEHMHTHICSRFSCSHLLRVLARCWGFRGK